MSVIKVKHPELFDVIDENGNITSGGDQHWFPKEGFIPPGACGATTASNILAYLLRSRPELYALAQEADLGGIALPLMSTPVLEENDKTQDVNAAPSTKDGYLEFMKRVYRFLYPRVGGLLACHFLEGIAELANEHRIPVSAECLRVPIAQTKRPSFAKAAEFICSSLDANIPVAFLILSGGGVAGLDTWHWVTILAIDDELKSVEILDNTVTLWADLGIWLETSIMGGSFIRLFPG